MRFIRIAAGESIHFGLLDAGGMIVKLNNRPEDPVDFLGLYVYAGDRDETVAEAAGRLRERGHPLPWTIAEVDVDPVAGRPHLLLPFTPPEIWGAAFTYLRGDQTLESPLIRERRARPPVIFFKATPHRYAGPGEAVGSRADTTMMIPEPELGLILSSAGDIIGYTIVNDVSSRDLPRQDPLYVCYSKIFDRCVSFGPVAATPESVADPLDLQVTVRVRRHGELLWNATGNTSGIYWSHEELIRHTVAHNPVPDGTLLATGTVLSPPADMHITEGDVLEVEIAGLGRLTNPVVTV